MVEEKGTISIHTENIFPIIKKFLYSDHEIFLRELVSNAVDATQKVKRLSSLGELGGELGDDLKIEVSFDKEAKTITVSDKGIGMTADDIKKYINQIAFSGASEFLEKYKNTDDAKQIIGHFGLGFYSSFMVAEKVEINSLSHEKGAEPAHWICDGSTEFELKKGSRATRGTDIILHINKDSVEFLEESRIQGILDKYCKFLPVEIKFGNKTEYIPDGKDKEGKEKTKEVEVDNIINNPSPAWTKSPSELKDEDYLNFYKELYPFSEEPLFWIHLNVDYPFNLTGILYFPKIKNDLDPNRNKIQLYSRQVFITDEVKDVVPEYLMLLHGVIDSPDIPLNVSRSYLQSDSNVKKINSHISKKVTDKLNELFKSNREDFEKKFDDISIFVKYGMLSDDKFYDRAKNFFMFKNLDNNYFTVEEYKEKIKDEQTGKDDQITILYSNDPAKQDFYIQSAKKRNYDIAVMDSPIDNHFINTLESKLEKVNIKRIDADSVDKLIEKEEKPESVLSEDDEKKVKEVFEKALTNQNMTVQINAMSPDEQPVQIVQPEFMRRMKDMQELSGGFGMMGNMPDSYNVVVNANHKLTSKLIKENEETQQELAKQAVNLAKLGQGMLSGSDLTQFIDSSFDLLINDPKKAKA